MMKLKKWWGIDYHDDFSQKNINNMTDFNEKLTEWSNKVVNYCHEIAINPNYDMDLTFYAFQSTPKENPELLILGINPKGEFTYADLYSNPIWGLADSKRMTSEVFVQENPFFHKHHTWVLWKNLSKSFLNSSMNTILTDSMYMNFVYFNTPNIDALLRKKHGKEVFNKCRDFSLELITDIVKPKQILCLGTLGCYDKLPITNKECLLKQSKRLLLKGKLSNIPVYGIPHPSGSITSDHNRNRIGDLLRKDFC